MKDDLQAYIQQLICRVENVEATVQRQRQVIIKAQARIERLELQAQKAQVVATDVDTGEELTLYAIKNRISESLRDFVELGLMAKGHDSHEVLKYVTIAGAIENPFTPGHVYQDPPPPTTGQTCTGRCGEHYPYAEPHADGSPFVCFGCRG